MACQTEDYASGDFLGGFTSYLLNGWSVNLRAIENCIFSIRSIERNMRPILRTVYIHVSVSNLYIPIPMIGPQMQYSKIGGPIVGIYQLLTDT
jgi:hypothetical protein